jgi:hypothetical protein
MNKKFKQVSIPLKTYEKLCFLAKAQGLSYSKLLVNFTEPLFQVGLNYPKSANLETEISILSSSVTFRFSGKSTFVLGQCSEKELEDMRHRLFTEAQTEIHKKKVVKK